METVDRRGFLAAAAVTGFSPLIATGESAPHPARAKGRFKHSVCRWCHSGMSLEELCKGAAEIGLASVELLGEKEWETPRQHGLECAVANGPGPIQRGWNRTEHHDELVREGERLLPLVKAAGIPNMIVFSGNRDGLADADGIRNCVTGLKRLTPLAESLGVTIIMEMLNSKEHTDYHADRTWWAVEVAKGIASERFKLLYDIYHMQRMEGDVIQTIQNHAGLIGHYHTGGVPGRAEIDQSQELNYRTICEAIAATGYAGYIGQEFLPRRDAMASLREAVAICDV